MHNIHVEFIQYSPHMSTVWVQVTATRVPGNACQIGFAHSRFNEIGANRLLSWRRLIGRAACHLGYAGTVTVNSTDAGTSDVA